MDNAIRWSGSAASLLGVLVQLGLVAASIPGLRRCPGCRPLGWVAPPPAAVDIWRPFIDNPGEGRDNVRQDLRCPEPRGTGNRYILDAAPLPDGYDPHAYGERKVLACVLVGAGGRHIRRSHADRHRPGHARRQPGLDHSPALALPPR